jgi:hypothetical protein
LFHLAATVAGIRPAAFGFARVAVCPAPGFGLQRMAVRIPHPRGQVALEIKRCGACWQGELATPVPAATPSGEVPAGTHSVEWPA